MYFIMLFPTHFKFLLFNERLDFCDLKKNNRTKGLTIQINSHSLFLIIFTKGAEIFGHDCIHYIVKSIGPPPFNERFDYFSNFHEYKS